MSPGCSYIHLDTAEHFGTVFARVRHKRTGEALRSGRPRIREISSRRQMDRKPCAGHGPELTMDVGKVAPTLLVIRLRRGQPGADVSLVAQGSPSKESTRSLMASVRATATARTARETP
jgi:hypothetical protein